MAHVAAPLVAALGDTHPPRAAGEVAALDGLDDIATRRRRLHRPVQPVVALLDLERAGMPADRNADVVDGRDEVVEADAAQGGRLDDLFPAAEVAALDAIGDAPADAPAVDLEVERALLELAGDGTVRHRACLLRVRAPRERAPRRASSTPSRARARG